MISAVEAAIDAANAEGRAAFEHLARGAQFGKVVVAIP